MKRLQHWFARRGALILSCYLVAVIVWLVLGAFHGGSDALAKQAGTMYETEIAVTDWQWVGLQDAGSTAETAVLATTDGDPQMILEDVSDMVVRTVSYQADFAGDAGEMCLYYTTQVGQDYSQDRRVFPESLGDGAYLYTLPRTTIVALRLDPCSPGANKTVEMTFPTGTITINAAETLPALWQYFVPSWYQAFCLVLYPALVAAALSWLRAVWQALRRRKNA